MRSAIPVKIAKIGYMSISVVLCVLGILLIVMPEISASILGMICGILMIVFGIVRLIGFFSKDLYRLAFQYDLAFGILMISLGVVMLVNPEGLLSFLCIALGLSVLADGLFKIQIALDSRRFGINTWWLILAVAVITGIFGLILLFRPGESGKLLSVLLGITLLWEGILNFSTMLTAVKIIKHQQPDFIEVDYYGERED